MSDPPLEDGRLERVVRRSAAHARRLTASIAGLGSARYTGGVDPIDPVGIAGETATVTGWARAEPRRLVAVVVLVDGEPVALGQVHLADHRTGSGVTPWLAQVPFPEDGTVVVSAVAVLTTGLALLLDRQARVTPTPPPPPPEPEPFVGDLDEPRSGAEVAASLFTVRGWCTIDPIARIEVSIDGRSSPARQMALARPDVASQIDSPHAGFCGYEHVVDLSGHRPGDEVTLTVTGVGPDGARQPIGEAVVRVAGARRGPPDADRRRLPRRPTRPDHLGDESAPPGGGGGRTCSWSPTISAWAGASSTSRSSSCGCSTPPTSGRGW